MRVLFTRLIRNGIRNNVRPSQQQLSSCIVVCGNADSNGDVEKVTAQADE